MKKPSPHPQASDRRTMLLRLASWILFLLGFLAFASVLILVPSVGALGVVVAGFAGAALFGLGFLAREKVRARGRGDQ